MMVVFTIFFGRMAGVPSGDMPYPLFAYAGLLPWTFFATAIADAGNSVVGSERLITKIYFPRLAVPFAAVGSGRRGFPDRFRPADRDDGLLSGCTRSGIAARCPLIFGCDPVGGAGDRHAPGGLERGVPRHPLRDPVPGPDLDVRHAVGLHASRQYRMPWSAPAASRCPASFCPPALRSPAKGRQ